MHVTAKDLRRLQLAELDILTCIDRVCKENNIEYFLDSGTMLGAARHGGFIPWDDDVDIAMPRASYEKFLEVGQRELGSNYFLQTRGTDPNALHSIAKVRMNGTEMIEKVAEETGAHQGIWVDVFPFDMIDGSSNNIAKKRREWRLWHRLYSVRLTKMAQPGLSVPGRVIRRIIHTLLCVLPIDFYISRLDGLSEGATLPENSCLVCFHYPTAFVPLAYEDVYPIGSMEFEGHRFSVPRNWNRYLELAYGNWRQLPPKSQRRTHDVVSLHLPNDDQL